MPSNRFGQFTVQPAALCPVGTVQHVKQDNSGSGSPIAKMKRPGTKPGQLAHLSVIYWFDCCPARSSCTPAEHRQERTLAAFWTAHCNKQCRPGNSCMHSRPSDLKMTAGYRKKKHRQRAALGSECMPGPRGYGSVGTRPTDGSMHHF